MLSVATLVLFMLVAALASEGAVRPGGRGGPADRDVQCRQWCEWMGDEFVGQNDLGCLCLQAGTRSGPEGWYNSYDWTGGTDRHRYTDLPIERLPGDDADEEDDGRREP